MNDFPLNMQFILIGIKRYFISLITYDILINLFSIQYFSKKKKKKFVCNIQTKLFLKKKKNLNLITLTFEKT